jgi:chromosome segregation ATPase
MQPTPAPGTERLVRELARLEDKLATQQRWRDDLLARLDRCDRRIKDLGSEVNEYRAVIASMTE